VQNYFSKAEAENIQWEVYGPEGGYISVVAGDPGNSNVLYAGTIYGPGLLKSTDQGASWSSVNTDALRDTHIYDILVDATDSSIYLATESQGVLKSTNGGKNWTPFNEGFELGQEGQPPLVCILYLWSL